MIIDELLQQCSPVTFTALESASGMKRVRLTIGHTEHYEGSDVEGAIAKWASEQRDSTQPNES